MARSFRTAALSAAFAAALASGAAAQEIDYPHDSVTLVTHSRSGGGTDVFLREMVQFLGPVMGVDFVVENVQGGSGAKAMAKLASSPADGAIFYGTTPTFINTSLLAELQSDWNDLEGVVNVFMDPQVVYVRADSPFQNLTEVVEKAKEGPQAVKFGVTTPGSLDRQVMEKFKAITGAEGPVITHDGGGELLISVLNGTVDVGIGEIQELTSQLEAEELRLITTYTEDRLEAFPDVPTAREQDIDLVVNKFRGIAGPKGLPEDVKEKWSQAIETTLQDPEFKEWYTAQALVPTVIAGEEYDKFLAEFAKEQEDFFKQYGITDE